MKRISLFFLIIFCALLFGQQREESKILKTNANALAWESIGPGGGNITAMAFNPNNQNEIFAGIFESGDIFKTVNAGQAWEKISSPEWGNMNSIALDPKNPNNIYALQYYGIHKSEDGGSSWELYYFPEDYKADINSQRRDCN